MNYKLQCLACGATCWVRGWYADRYTNEVQLDDNRPREWDGGKASCQPCDHEEYGIVDSDTDQGDD